MKHDFSELRLDRVTRAFAGAGGKAFNALNELTLTVTFDTAASRARIAARRLLRKQPPSATNRYSPPSAPRSSPPFPTGRSTRTECDRACAVAVDGPTCSNRTVNVWLMRGIIIGHVF